MKYDVFISYSRRDYIDNAGNIIPGNVVSKILALFEEYKKHYNFEYFFDQDAIMSQHEYLKRISTAIADSRVMLFIASENSYASEFCSKELLFADKRRVHIHQYCIDDAIMPDDIDMLLGTHQYRKLRSCSEETIVSEVLSDALAKQIMPIREFKAIEVANNKDEKSSKRYKVGDYYDDGTKQGVVFKVWDNGAHGKIVSLDQSKDELQWCTDEQFDKECVVDSSSNSSGADNTSKIIARSDRKEYPAFMWCVAKGSDWYLPAVDELELLLLNDKVLDAVNKTLVHYNATPIFKRGVWESYWSSMECSQQAEYCAWRVFMGGGCVYGSRKCNYNYVRAVATF